jgi:hypothetical protein
MEQQTINKKYSDVLEIGLFCVNFCLQVYNLRGSGKMTPPCCKSNYYETITTTSIRTDTVTDSSVDPLLMRADSFPPINQTINDKATPRQSCTATW